jgi:hypothetical protein
MKTADVLQANETCTNRHYRWHDKPEKSIVESFHEKGKDEKLEHSAETIDKGVALEKTLYK